MPMLADLDDPPASRGRDLMVGLVVGAPLAGLLFGWLIPAFVGAVVGGANELDGQLRAQEDYMRELCGAPQLPRDEALCGCVFAMEFPALDCQDELRPWLAARAGERCADPSVERASKSFCVCTGVVHEDLVAAAAADDEAAARHAGQGMERCLALPDALTLEQVYAPGSSP